MRNKVIAALAEILGHLSVLIVLGTLVYGVVQTHTLENQMMGSFGFAVMLFVYALLLHGTSREK